MRTGEIEVNIVTLNQTTKLSYLDELIEIKMSGPEKGTLNATDFSFYESEFNRLLAELEAAHNASHLREVPEGKAALSDLLIRIRTTPR